MDAAAGMPDETDLVQRCRAGDDAAFGSLYHAFAGRVRAYFLRSGFSSRPADADDLTQETFVRAFRGLGSFDAGRGALGPWLAAIARNVARRHWGRRPQPDHADPELAEETLALLDSPGQAIESREELTGLADCIACLPGVLAEIVTLRYVQGLTTRGIAAAAGLAEATVRLRLAEIHRLLAECMQSKGLGG